MALYKGEIEKAEALLRRAANESSMVEPRILLSQLYWKHRSKDDFGDGKDGYEKALEELTLIAKSNTPRREVLTNYGLLKLRMRNNLSK